MVWMRRRCAIAPELGSSLRMRFSHLGRGLLGEGDREEFLQVFVPPSGSFRDRRTRRFVFRAAGAWTMGWAAHIERVGLEADVPHLLHHSPSISSSASHR